MEHSRDWMEQARRDLEHSRVALQANHFEWACFAAQQSAAKAVKAVFQRLHAETRGHSVTRLLEALQEHHPVADELLDRARELDQAYLPARYPNAHPAGAPGEAYTRRQGERRIAHAEEILRFCDDLLSRP